MCILLYYSGCFAMQTIYILMQVCYKKQKIKNLKDLSVLQKVREQGKAQENTKDSGMT